MQPIDWSLEIWTMSHNGCYYVKLRVMYFFILLTSEALAVSYPSIYTLNVNAVDSNTKNKQKKSLLHAHCIFILGYTDLERERKFLLLQILFTRLTVLDEKFEANNVISQRSST